MDQPVANKHTVNTLTDSGDFRWYLTTHASWFFGMGLQMVIFPYLVAEVLLGSPKMIGIAQMFDMKPSCLIPDASIQADGSQIDRANAEQTIL